MHIQTYHIIPALRPYVKVICTMECSDGADTSHIRVLPDACVELFLNYTSTPVAIIGGELHARSIVTSRMSRPVDVQMRKGAGVVAICFRPGMAYKFMQLPMYGLSDTTIACADVWKDMAAELEEKMAGSGSNQARVNLVQQYLQRELARAKDDVHIAYCLKQVRLSKGLVAVAGLAHGTGLSQRQLSRKFREHVGLSAQEYLRVSRFIFSLDHLKGYPAFSLTEIACKSGYYDQAHFIRDYKDYTGCTPGQLVQSPHICWCFTD